MLVHGGSDELVLSIENGPASDEAALTGVGTGNGLRGLRERVSACASTVEAGPTPDGGLRLSARLPRRMPLPAS